MKARVWGFLGIEAIIYVMFLVIDCTEICSNQVSTYLKFAGIVLCVGMNVMNFFRRQAYDVWISLAFLFLFLSDYHLLITNSYESGVFTFLIVQICFQIYLQRLGKNQHPIRTTCIRTLYLAGMDGLILTILWNAGVEVDLTVLFAGIYFLWFVLNVGNAIQLARTTRTHQICFFTAGLILYFICDLNVGIFNLGEYVAMTGGGYQLLYEFAAIAMWLFYLPGVVLITLSNDAALHGERLHD